MREEVYIKVETAPSEITAWLKRVSQDGERLVLTTRGKPTAVIVSLADYQYIQTNKAAHIPQNWQSWLDKHAQLMTQLEKEGFNQALDIDAFLAEAKQERDERVDYLFDN